MIRELRSNYSFTELKRIDWDRLARKYSVGANDAATPKEFAAAIVPMLAELRDLHVWVQTEQGERIPTYRSGFTPNYDHRYVRSKLSDFKQFENLGFIGRVRDVGVVVITGLPVEADYAGLIMAIRSLENVRAVVVDLRRNSGGSEPQASRIAALFASKRMTYARNQRCDSGELYESAPRYFDPADSEPLKVPVACLIGPGCVSSGEGFALMMKSLDQVTVIGQPTRGASGNPQPVKLSNGVRVWFSRWVSMELDGTPIEGRGVLPGLTVKHVEGRDATFDRALELLQITGRSDRE